MAITTSTFTTARQRADILRIEERHVDHLGVLYQRTYEVASTADIPALLAATASRLDVQLGEEEFARNLRAILLRQYNRLAANYATLNQHRQLLRAYYRDRADMLEVTLIAAYLLTLTDGQLQSLFGVSAGAQTTSLKSRLQVRADVVTALDAATGE